MSDGFFSRAAGQQRRAALDNALSGFANRYLGPTGIPERLNALAELFPVAEMERGSLAAQRVAGADNWQDRVSGTGDVLSAVASVVAPGLALNRVGSGPAVALSESLAGVSSSPTAQGAREMGARFVADEFGGMGPGKGIRAYHGSPHDFDKFSMDKIGTGEGAQAYGHGLYFAENEGVARGYRDALSGGINNLPVSIDGVRYSPPSDVHQRAIAIIAKDGRSGAQEVVRRGLSEGSMADETARAYREVLAATKGRAVTAEPAGRLYEVNINANPEDFLDWDAPLSAQSKVVQDGVNRVGRSVASPLARVHDSMKGNDLKPLLQDPRAVEELSNYIPGIRYLDAGSRGAGDGSRNYVVFDESLIEIVRKYGIAGAAAMLGMSQADVAQAMGQGQQNALAPADYTADPQEIRNYLAGL